MHVIPLGTGSAIPTRHRNLSATALDRGGEVLLFDCGEGTQLQLLKAGIRHSRISAILISHLHGDHLYGLPGLLSTMTLLHRVEPLTIIGPGGIAAYLDAMPGYAEDEPPEFPIEFVELQEGFGRRIVIDRPDYFVEARPLEHRIITVGYRFQEKDQPGNLDVERARELGVTDYVHYRILKEGKPVVLGNDRVIQPRDVLGEEKRGRVFAYITDTRPCEGGRLLARRADLLQHEATFLHDLLDRARETGHSTAYEAADLAAEAGVGRLLLSHFSARYQDAAPLLDEARAVFERTDAAEELVRYPVEKMDGFSG